MRWGSVQWLAGNSKELALGVLVSNESLHCRQLQINRKDTLIHCTSDNSRCGKCCKTSLKPSCCVADFYQSKGGGSEKTEIMFC